MANDLHRLQCVLRAREPHLRNHDSGEPMRISRHSMFMGIAEIAARRSTCYRRAIGAVIVLQNNIISLGYNGPPSGEHHCLGRYCVPPGTVGCPRSIHAESNAIRRSPPELIDKPGRVMYTTESPCTVCAREIVETGISAMYYLNPYRIPDGLTYVAQRIPTYRMTPSGYIIDERTGEFVVSNAGTAI